jgi:hypothetical protein
VSLAFLIGTAKEPEEKFEWVTSAAEAAAETKTFIAALEALRHPKKRVFLQALKP